jgi:hypothetical protein
METKTYNFQNPELQKKATQKARFSPKPKTYNSKSKRVEAAKKELIKQELLKEGFLQQVGAVLPRINEALIKSASNPKAGATDRKTVYTILGLLTKDDGKGEPAMTMGQILADLAKS